MGFWPVSDERREISYRLMRLIVLEQTSDEQFVSHSLRETSGERAGERGHTLEIESWALDVGSWTFKVCPNRTQRTQSVSRSRYALRLHGNDIAKVDTRMVPGLKAGSPETPGDQGLPPTIELIVWRSVINNHF